MKLIFITIALFITSALIAQTTTDELQFENPSGGVYYYLDNVSIDSAGVVWSDEFSLSMCDGFSWATYPFDVKYDVASADSVNMLGEVYYKMVGDQWAIADTLFSITAADSARTTANFNNIKAIGYKIKITNNAGSKANSDIELEIYQGKRDIED